ncbi:MAG: TrbG/VirB9 family P-type conjugative transfer protein [Rickettsiales bacterium]|nr:TrbG/VirB9 family P-type conjugative transfer protein [Rickettsiales bacterium]
MVFIRSITLQIFLLLFFCIAFAPVSFSDQVPVTMDSRIRTLVYNSNEVYELKFYYGYQSFIEFAEDEEIEMISIGEAFAWRLTPAGKRLFVRPLEIAGHTNMTIITNKRTYHFDIRSGEYDGKADEELVYTVRFFYPQVGQPLPIPPRLSAPNPAAAPVKQSIIRTPLPQANIDKPLPAEISRNPDNSALNFDFSIAGTSDNIMPSKVYDDTKETFFAFPNDNLIVPSISLVDAHGGEQPLNYIIRDGFVVVPAVGRQFTLRLADSLICVYNNKALNYIRR